jgi:hypothetical protein
MKKAINFVLIDHDDYFAGNIWYYDTQRNDIQLNYIQQNNIQHNGTQ